MSEMRDLLEALDASVRKAQAVARDTRAIPAEETPAVTLPSGIRGASKAALDAAEASIRYSAPDGDARRTAAGALLAALPHLLPGLFVAPDGGDCLTIWGQVADPSHSVALMVRTQHNARLFDAVAALLPIEE